MKHNNISISCATNSQKTIQASIHPPSTAYLGPGRGGSSLSSIAQTSLSPDTISSSLGGIQGHS